MAEIERRADARFMLDQLKDIKEQVHEIKHAQNAAAQKVTILEQVSIAHRTSDDLIHARFLEEVGEIKNQIIENRSISGKRFDDLFAWRNRIYGVIAVVVLVLTIWGDNFYEVMQKIFRRG